MIAYITTSAKAAYEEHCEEQTQEREAYAACAERMEQVYNDLNHEREWHWYVEENSPYCCML